MAGSAGVGLASKNVSQALREAPGCWGMGRPTGEVGCKAGQEIILHLLSAYSVPGTRTRAPPAVTSNPSTAVREALLSPSYLKHGATEAQTGEGLCSTALSDPAVNRASLSSEPVLFTFHAGLACGLGRARHVVSLSWAALGAYLRPQCS